MSGFKRILVPVDGSECSNKALVAALQLARESGGKLRVVHSIDELAYISGYEYSSAVIGAARDAAAKVLSDAQAIAQASGVPADSELVDRPAQRLGETVADEASKWEADLIAVGTHGRRGIGRVLLGSGAEQIIRNAPVPVLVVRGN
jgi:nucleotide-binding universal stress UspA family protein